MRHVVDEYKLVMRMHPNMGLKLLDKVVSLEQGTGQHEGFYEHSLAGAAHPLKNRHIPLAGWGW